MRLLITLLFLSLTLVCSSQAGNRNLWFKRTTVTPPAPGNQPFSFTAIPFSALDSMNPGRGAEQWHNGSEGIPNPSETDNRKSWDLYYREQWGDLEGPTQGDYLFGTYDVVAPGDTNWSKFDDRMHEAITNGQQLSFGIMTVFTGNGVNSYAGGESAYPLYLHNLMFAETANSRDWLTGGGDWIPNFNSPNYLARLRALHVALNAYILSATWVPQTGPHAGTPIRYRDVIYCIDIRGYGNYGEWHSGGFATWTTFPTGRQPTIASLKEIIDTHTEVFTSWPLVIMIAAYDGGVTQIDIFVPEPEVAYYALTTTTPLGDSIGWRRDQWGATDGYLNTLLAGNTMTYNGSQQFRNYILNRYKNLPITGEPPRWDADGWVSILGQITTYHATSFGNGNYGPYPDPAGRDRLRTAFKTAGYRLIITTGTAPQTITRNVSFNITCNWQNTGISPAYNGWTVQYELQTGGGSVVWTGTSSKVLRKFLPGAATLTTDLLTVPIDVSTGTYKLVVRVKDPLEYRPNMQLMINGLNSDGSYTIFPSVVVN